MTSFAGKLVLITGASSGIGKQAARDFASRNARIILVARRLDRLKSLAEEIKSAGGHAQTLPCDLSDPWSRDRLISDLQTQNLIPDILINNAGYGNFRPFLQESPENIHHMTAVNYLAPAHLMSSLLPEMVRRGSGAIVNIASSAGRVAVPNMAIYCATKFAVDALNQGMRMDLLGTAVRVTSVAPGLVETEFSDVRFRGDKERAAKPYENLTPLCAEDIAETRNLASSHNSVVEDLQALLELGRSELGDARTGRTGSGIRPPAISPSPAPLTTYDPDHPYFAAEYDLPDRG